MRLQHCSHGRGFPGLNERMDMKQNTYFVKGVLHATGAHLAIDAESAPACSASRFGGMAARNQNLQRRPDRGNDAALQHKSQDTNYYFV